MGSVGADIQQQFTWLLFKLGGRLGRAPYLLAFLFIGLFQAFPFYRYLIAVPGSTSSDGWAMLFLLSLVASLYCYVAITVKRLHDLGRPGLEAAWLFVPIISLIVFVALCIVPGQRAANRYGADTNADA